MAVVLEDRHNEVGISALWEQDHHFQDSLTSTLQIVLIDSGYGGNEESDFPELLTAREWSEDEEGPEDDLSSSSLWGTPRQNSFELTFSYIAFSEGESSGRRDSGRRRTGGRGRRGSLRRMDTVETFLPPDSPAVEWDPLNFLSGEEEQRVVENQLPELVESHNRTLESSSQGIGYFPDDKLQGEMEKIILQEACYVTDSYEGTGSHHRLHTID
ncbi:reticulon 2a isoform X1 [Silurus meridionalis]|nr:reticulon 2a isoform X1 [Silurus meridionalis]